MRKRAERTRKNDRFVRLLSGLLIGGAILFQGTGFITSEARAADPTARNRDVTSFIDVTNLSDKSNNYGLYGSPLSQSVNIYNGVTAVIGKLTSESTSLNPASAVSMTMESGSAFRVGLNQEGTSTLGSLIISVRFLAVFFIVCKEVLADSALIYAKYKVKFTYSFERFIRCLFRSSLWILTRLQLMPKSIFSCVFVGFCPTAITACIR